MRAMQNNCAKAAVAHKALSYVKRGACFARVARRQSDAASATAAALFAALGRRALSWRSLASPEDKKERLNQWHKK